MSVPRAVVAASLVAIATLIVIAQWILDAAGSAQVGWDFPVFYIAGCVPIHDVYNSALFQEYWRAHLAPLGVPHWAPYVRPAIFAFPLHLMAKWSFHRAFAVWLISGAGAYAASAWLAIWKFRLPGFFFPAAAGFFPAVAGLIGGADVAFILLGLVVALIALENHYDAVAGIALAACLCKFNLIMLIPIALLQHHRRRTLLWFVAAGTVLFTASALLTSPAAYANAVMQAQMNTPGFFPVGLRGSTAAIGMSWLYPVLAIVTLLVFWSTSQHLSLLHSIGAATVATLMISPYVAWYDSTLLLLPIALIASQSGVPMRAVCLAILAAVPFWRHGGGNNGPIGFMHIGVELVLLFWFARKAGLRIFRYRVFRSI